MKKTITGSSRNSIAKQRTDTSARTTSGSSFKHSNVFVIGDLIIDHTVFVNSAQSGQLEPVTGETAFQVQRRLDTAGGAATAARTISVSSKGTTFLWGLLGTSQWGTFRSILENSQALDGAERPIELRGTQDETDAPMSTVSRLVLVHHAASTHERYERKARFVDSGKVHVPLSKLNDVSYHVESAHATHPLDAIVLDDLNAGALDINQTNKISALALRLNIPLIVRVRRHAEKYVGVRARALVCSLAEWVHLVGSEHDTDYWRRNIGKHLVADDLARLSLFAFPSIDYHVILVGDDWIDSIITVETAAAAEIMSKVVVRPGVPEDEKGKSHQVGTSDVFTGTLALELSGTSQTPAPLALAIARAAQVAAHYQRMSWHRIPQIDGFHADLGGEVASEGPYGTRYLPRTDTIEMVRARTTVPGILSVTAEMLESLERLQKDIEGGWDEAQSMILVATGGSGKTAIGDELIAAARRQGHEARWFSELKKPWNWSNPADILAAVRPSDSGKKVLIAVDEVLKLKGARNIATTGVVLLNDAKENGIRFLFIDADFSKTRIDGLQSQFGRRCSLHILPSAWHRAPDIPYVMAHCLRRGFADHPPKVCIDASALVSVVEWMLRGKRNFGELDKLCKQIAKNHGDSDSMSVSWSELPAAVRGAGKPLDGWEPSTYRVTYD